MLQPEKDHGYETGSRPGDVYRRGSHRRPEAHAQHDVRGDDDVPEAAMFVAHHPRAIEGKNFAHNIVRVEDGENSPAIPTAHFRSRGGRCRLKAHPRGFVLSLVA